MRKINYGFTTVVIWRVYHGLVGLNLDNPLIKSDTVDGRNPKQPPGMYTSLYINIGINYQPQLVYIGR